MRRFARLIALLLLSAPAGAWGDAYAPPCDGDTWIKESSPSETHGSDSELRVKTKNGDHERALYHFDLSSIPAGSTILMAQFSLTVTSADATGQPMLLFRMNQPWNEATANWTNSGNGLLLAEPDGSFSAAAEGLTWIDIGPLVQEWVDGTQPNYGCVIVATSNNSEARFASKEWDEAAERPILNVLTTTDKLAFRLRAGTYTGNGLENRAVTGLGFTPDLVIIRGEVDSASVVRSSSMPEGKSKSLGRAEGLQKGAIQSLDPDGFTVGADPQVNEADVEYYWIAFRGAAGAMAVGSFVGDGSDNRNVTGLGLTPAYLIVSSEASQQAVQRFSAETGDASLTFGYEGETANRIQAMGAGSFQVGSSPLVNQAGVTFHYVGFGAATGMIASSGYVGNGSNNRSITSLGFQPEYVIIKQQPLTYSAVQRPSSYPTPKTLHVGEGPSFNNGIRSFVPGGFLLGSHAGVNAFGLRYYYAGFADNPEALTDVAISKSVDVPRPNEGDPVRFVVSATVLGPGDATDLVVHDLLPEGLAFVRAAVSHGLYDPSSGAWAVGVLAAGDAATLELVATVVEGTAGWTITNTGSLASMDQLDANEANDEASVEMHVQAADLAIVKLVDDTSPNELGTVQYDVTVANQGPDRATGILVKDLLPAGIVYASHAASQGTYGSGDGLWHVGDLINGGLATLRLTGTVAAGAGGATISNQASIVEADQGDTDPTDNAASADLTVQLAELALDKQVDDANPREGQVIGYSVTVRNAGPDAATSLVVTDLLPEGVTYQSHAATIGAYVPGSGTWSIGTLGVGSIATLQIHAFVDAGTATETIVNTASASSVDQADHDPNDDTASIAIDVQGADLALTKAVDDPAPLPGQTITYTVTVQNAGPDPASGIEVSDLLPAGVTHAGHAATQGSYTAGEGIWIVGSLQNGGEAELSIDATVDEDVDPSVVIVNTATRTASSPEDPSSANDTAAASIHLAPSVEVTVLSQASSVVRPGDEAIEVFRVRLLNQSEAPVTLQSLLVANACSGPGTQTERDQDWSLLRLFVEDGEGPALELATASFAAGAATFTNLGAILPAGASRELVIHGGASLSSRDSDSLDLLLASADALDFEGEPTVDGPFPLDPVGFFPIDGMVSAQIGLEPVPPGTVAAGGTGVLLLDLAVGANGYEADQLEQVTLLNLGTAQPGTDVAALMLWADGGDGVFDSGSGDDEAIGAASGSANEWTATGLDVPISAGGLRLFVAADLAAGALDGRTLQLSLPSAPQEGLLMASGNDGPIDRSVTNPSAITIEAVAVSFIVATAEPQIPLPIRPADAPATILTLRLENQTAAAETLASVLVHDASAGAGSSAQMDASWSSLTLLLGSSDPGSADPIPIGTAAMHDGVASFSNLALVLHPADEETLQVRAQASLTARDGDHLDLRVEEGASFVFRRPVPIEGDWPLDPAGKFPVDGLVAAQLSLEPVPSGFVVQGDLEVLSLELVVPGNGYEADQLEQIRIINLGDALANADIEALRVWVDGGDDVFDAGQGDDQLLGAPSGAGSIWTLSGLSHPLPATGSRLFASLDLSVNAREGRTIQLALPSAPGEAFEVASGNDGPIDATVANEGVRTILAAGADGISVAGAEQDGGVLLPGGVASEVFRFRLVNPTERSEHLTALAFEDATSGPGSREELDQDWSTLSLSAEIESQVDEGRGAASHLASGAMVDGIVRFEGFDLDIPAREAVTLTVEAGASLLARDGDLVDLTIADSAAFVFSPSIPVNGTWPLSPSGGYAVDGMAASQIVIHPVPAGALSAGTEGNLAFDVTIPANGYEVDVLDRFDLVDAGTAEAGRDIVGIDLWADDGDGGFSVDGDTHIGAMSFTGARWQVTGLDRPVPGDGIRIFACVRLGGLAVNGRTVRLGIPSLPDPGVGMRSGNDGPRDASIENPFSLTISSADLVTVSSDPIDGGSVRPGEAAVSLLSLVLTNSYQASRTLTSLSVRSTSAGQGSQEDLDAALETLRLHRDGDDDGTFDGAPVDPLLATGSLAGGEALFPNLDLGLAPDAPQRLFVLGQVSTEAAADGDILSMELSGPESLQFEEPTSLGAVWPVESGGLWEIDGMVLRQLTNYGAGVTTLGPGDDAALALDVRIPSNGYAADLLEQLRVENRGTAGPSEIREIRLWRDGGDGIFSAGAGDDANLGVLTASGPGWTSPLLGEPLPVGGGRFFLSLSVAQDLADSATVRLAIPVAGVAAGSGNDGPLDAALESEETILLSSACLLTSLEVDPPLATVGQPVTVRMVVENRGLETLQGIVPSALEQIGTTTLDRVEGPAPASLDLGAAETDTFTWVYAARSAGEVRFAGEAQGSPPGGLLCSSLRTQSNMHRVFLEARNLEVFPVSAPPASVSRGQAGIVPLSLTFRNPAGELGSDVKLREIRLRVVSLEGQPIVPSSLLRRVVVREGSRLYADKGAGEIETSGSHVDLLLAPQVVVTTLEPVTVNLQIDLSEATSVLGFRVVVEGEGDLIAHDATSGLPVTLSLPGGAFPIQSGGIRILSEATAVEISCDEQEDSRVSPGQIGIPLLDFQVLNVGTQGITSDVQITGCTLSFVDAGGRKLGRPGAVLERVALRAPGLLLAEAVLDSLSPDSLLISFANPMTLGAQIPTTIEVEADVRGATPVTAFRTGLAGPASFRVRDANTRETIVPTYLSTEIAGSWVRVERPAQELRASGSPRVPSALTVGDRGVPAILLHLRHPGDAGTARIRLDEILVHCRNEERAELRPGVYVDGIRAFAQSVELARQTNIDPADDHLRLVFDGVLIEPGEAIDLELRIDIEADAPAGSLELSIGGADVLARDANSGHELRIVAESDSDLPVFSGLTRLHPPARELLVGLEERMPAVLAADGREVEIGTLVLRNEAPPESGPIRVDHLVMRAADASFAPVAVGGAVRQLRLYREDLAWAASAVLSPDSATARIDFPEDLVLAPDTEIALEISQTMREDPTVGRLRIGWDEEDIGIVQPEGALLAVVPRLMKSGTFPVWTEAGTLGSPSLEGSFSNFPNPFAAGREATAFVYYLPADARVSLRMWTPKGEGVITLLDAESQSAGIHQESLWDGRNGRGVTVRNGVYLAELVVRFEDGKGERLLRKVAVVR